MASTRESLIEAVTRLTDDQARQVLGVIQQMLEPPPDRDALTREKLRQLLGSQPGITVPPADAPPFDDFEPVEVGGIPASELLISDRR